MMILSAILTTFCVLLHQFSALSNAEDEQVKVSEFYRELGEDDDVPEKLELSFRLDGKPVELRLERSDSIPADLPVIIGSDNQHTYWRRKPGSRLTAYVDKGTQSSLVVEKNTHSNGLKTRLYRGNFHMDNQFYTLSPHGEPVSAARSRLQRSDVRSSRVSIDGVDHVISPVSFDELRPYESGTEDHSSHRSAVDFRHDELLNGTAQWTLNTRSNKKHYKVELFIVLDYAMYKHWKHHKKGDHNAAIKALKHYFTQVASGIDIRYATIVQSDLTIRVHLVAIFIATTANDAPWCEDPSIKTVFKNDEYVNMYKALDRFEIWVGKDTSKFPAFDHATLYTSNDLFDGTFYDDGRPKTKLGLANMRQVCQKSKRVSINFEFGEYASIQTGAHELGHNLGAQHDGTLNNCKGVNQYIMCSAPTELNDATFKHALTFSHCSISYFRKHFNKLNSRNENCLLTTSSQNIVADDRYPGRIYPIDEQCQDLYGDDSFFCGGGIHEKTLCEAMQCWYPKEKFCYTQPEQRAYVGTTCGNHKWCMKGKCISDPRAPASKDFCIFGDFRGLVFIDQNTKLKCTDAGRRYPWKCYENSHSKTCCKTCVDISRKDKPGCEYGDKNPTWCKQGKKSDCYDKRYAAVCCDRCEKLKSNQKGCEYGDKASWCPTTIKEPAWQCYNQHSTCCETCKRFKTNIKDCEYGDKASWCKTVGVTKQRCSPSDLGKQCCATCEKLVPGGVNAFPTTPKPQTNAECPEGDKASYCSTIKSFNCYAAAKQCCISCAKYKTNIPGCEYGDKASWCAGYVKGPKNCKRQQIVKQCCKSCKKYQRTTNDLERAADAAACRVTSDAEMLMLCKDAGKRSQCLRCMRERITGRLRYGQ